MHSEREIALSFASCYFTLFLSTGCLVRKMTLTLIKNYFIGQEKLTIATNCFLCCTLHLAFTNSLDRGLVHFLCPCYPLIHLF